MTNEEIVGFDPVVDEDSVCPKGGGHLWHESYTDEFVQLLVCKECGKESLGHFNNEEDLDEMRDPIE